MAFARRIVLAVLSVASFTIVNPALAQTTEYDHRVFSVAYDSGERGSVSPHDDVVYSQDLRVDGAPWIRVIFDVADLKGASYVRITSKLDNDTQFLDATTIKQWQMTSAYFNGSAVTVEVVAAPGTKGNRVAISRVLGGFAGPQPGERRVCSATDTRVVSADMRTARLLSVRLPVPNCPAGFPCGAIGGGVCTGWLINDTPNGDPTNRLMLSAGHCFDPFTDGMTVAEFEPIPRSQGATCQVQHPPVAKQFAVDATRVRYTNGSGGNDWSAFVCFANPVTNRTPFQEQGAAFTRGPAPAVNAALTKFGYGSQGQSGGTDPFCVCTPGGTLAIFNNVQQTSNGVARNVAGTRICHDLPTCGGDSGGPLIAADGRAAGIHTDGVCSGTNDGCGFGLPFPRNGGTTITNANLVAAINALVGGGTPPQNDACGSAVAVGDGSFAFSTVNATTDGNTDVLCTNIGDSNIQPDIWYLYTASGTGNTVFSLCGSSFDTRVAVYPSGCTPAANTAIACNDDFAACGGTGRQSQVTVATVSGNTYLVRVGGYRGATGAGILTITPPRPPNDDCANAFVLPEGTWAYTTVNATTDSPAGCAILAEVWYGFVANANGTVEVSTCLGTGYDTYLSAYNAGAAGLCPPGAQLACNDDACGVQSRISFAVVSGQTYLVAVGGRAGATGPGFITRSAIIGGAGPSNNGCANASLVVNGNNPFTTVGATTDGPGTVNGCTIPNDVWFQYVATATGQLEVNTCASAFDTVLAAYEGSCGALPNPIACNDDACGAAGRQSRIRFSVGAGRTYTIRVGGFNGATGTGVLQIVPPSGAPVNDSCIVPIAVTNGATFFNTTNATNDGPAGCAMSKDLWYRYTATRSGLTRFSTCGSYYDTVLAVYDSVACPPVNLKGCSDDSLACGAASRQSQLDIPTLVGRTYTVQVGGFNGASGEGVLIISPVVQACPCDFNVDGRLNSQDFFDFVSAFFLLDPRADYNSNGVINSQDFFDFITCFFSLPAGC